MLGENEFSITVDYALDAEAPEKVFKSIAKMIEGIRILDEPLGRCVGAEGTYKLILTNIEHGSIRMVFKTLFFSSEAHPITQTITNNIEKYLTKSKNEIFKYISNNKTPTNDSLKDLEAKIDELASQSGINELGFYSQVDRRALLKGTMTVSDGIKGIGNSVSVNFDQENIDVSHGFDIDDTIIEELCAINTESYLKRMILPIKTIDFSGNKKWDFRGPDGKIIKADITDIEWLNQFKNREHLLRPGDALKTRVEITPYFSSKKKKMLNKYRIIKVYDVEMEQQFKEEDLFEGE